jgi:hypothetical protein
MIRSLFFLVCCIGLLHADIFSDLFISETEQVTGITFQVQASDPTTYSHTTGGGAWATSVATLDGYYFACGERASVVLLISTDSTYTTSTSSVFTLSFTAHPALKIKAIVNNCATSTADASTCINGGSVPVSLGSTGTTFQFTKLAKSSRVVIRLDFAIDCTQLTATGPAVSFNSFTVGSGSANSLSGVSLPFVHISSVYNCDDGNACTTDIIGGCLTSRSCSYIPKNFDDSNS